MKQLYNYINPYEAFKFVKKEVDKVNKLISEAKNSKKPSINFYRDYFKENFDIAVIVTETISSLVILKENYHAKKIDGLIDVKSYRIGNIFGIHRIEFKSEEGITNFQHIASCRDVFAKGALLAARSINSMETGEYSFADFLDKKL